MGTESERGIGSIDGGRAMGGTRGRDEARVRKVEGRRSRKRRKIGPEAKEKA